jgi:hypothetical protein
MALISNEGSVGLTSTILYECRPQNVCAINYIRFSNSVTNYDVLLQKYVASTASTVDIYSLNLTHGDTVTDDMTYILHPGDYISAVTTDVNTTFIISGEEGPNLSFLRCK